MLSLPLGDDVVSFMGSHQLLVAMASDEHFKLSPTCLGQQMKILSGLLGSTDQTWHKEDKNAELLWLEKSAANAIGLKRSHADE